MSSRNPLQFSDYAAEPTHDLDDDEYDLAYEAGRQAAIDHRNPFKEPKNPYPATDPRSHPWALGFRNEMDR